MSVLTGIPSSVADSDANDAAFFWAGLTRHEILFQRCDACGRHRFPPMPSCPYCAAPGGTIVRLQGVGSIYSAITVRRAFAQEFADRVPYTVAVVQLPERVRLVGVIPGDRARIGDVVVPDLIDRDGWTELRFALARTGDASCPSAGLTAETAT